MTTLNQIISSLPANLQDHSITNDRYTVSPELEFLLLKNGHSLDNDYDLEFVNDLLGHYKDQVKIVADGTSARLSGGRSASVFEMVFPPIALCPASILWLSALLELFKNNCREAGIKIRVNTNNTGFHCHLKLRSIRTGLSNLDFHNQSRTTFIHGNSYCFNDNWSENINPMFVADFMKRYEADQENTFQFMHDDRRTNCSHWADRIRRSIRNLDVTTVTDIAQLYQFCGSTDRPFKYEGISLNRFASMQTIEARQFHSTLNTTTIVSWCLFLHNLLITSIARFEDQETTVTRTIELPDNILDLPIPNGERAIRADSKMIPLYNLIYNNEMNVHDIIAYMNIQNSDPANKVRVYICNLRDRLELIYGAEIAGKILPTETFMNNGARYRDGVRNSSYRINRTVEIEDANTGLVFIGNDFTNPTLSGLPVEQLNFWNMQIARAREESRTTLNIQ
tara:strand:- start:861 stop:2216 length:1356 start_codon:yes stop_codon:yes gene_type:complete